MSSFCLSLIPRILVSSWSLSSGLDVSVPGKWKHLRLHFERAPLAPGWVWAAASTSALMSIPALPLCNVCHHSESATPHIPGWYQVGASRISKAFPVEEHLINGIQWVGCVTIFKLFGQWGAAVVLLDWGTFFIPKTQDLIYIWLSFFQDDYAIADSTVLVIMNQVKD